VDAVELAIAYARSTDDPFTFTDEPLAAVRLDDGMITLSGDDDFIARWTSYFQDDPTWTNDHLKEPKPLLSLFGRMSYQTFEVLEGADAQQRYQQAVDKIEGRTVTLKAPK
jgi:hypothetical protein